MDKFNFSYERLNITYYTKGNKKPLLFIHGGGTKANTYKETINFLSKKYKVYAPDLPFFGHSDSLNCSWDFNKYSEFLDYFITKLNLNKLVVVGYSFGGGVAYRLFFKTNKIKKLILCSPVLFPMNMNKRKLIKVILNEAKISFLSLKTKEERLIYFRVVRHFIKNLIKRFTKINLLQKTAINSLNSKYVMSKKDNIYVVISKEDQFCDYTKFKDFKKIVYVKGTHLWFLLNHKKFEKIFNNI